MDRHKIETLSGEDALAQLRERLRLYERVPQVEHVHPAAPIATEDADGGMLIPLCVHDAANETCHYLLYPAEAGSVLVDEQVAANVQLVLAAGWN